MLLLAHFYSTRGQWTESFGLFLNEKTVGKEYEYLSGLLNEPENEGDGSRDCCYGLTLFQVELNKPFTHREGRYILSKPVRNIEYDYDLYDQKNNKVKKGGKNSVISDKDLLLTEFDDELKSSYLRFNRFTCVTEVYNYLEGEELEKLEMIFKTGSSLNK